MPESKTPSIMKPLIAPISILGIVATFLCLSSGQVYGQNTPTPQAQTSIYDQNRLDAFDLQLSSLTHTLANASGGGSWSGGTVTNPSTFTALVSVQGPANFFVWIASQDSTNSSRLQFDSSWFVFQATTQYRFDFYGVMGSSTSNMFANINCLTNGGVAGQYNYINGGGINGSISQGYNGDSSSNGNGKSFSLNNEAANTDLISANGWLQGSVTYEALADTMTIREITGFSENDSSAKTTTSNTFFGGKYSGSGKGWTSICFDDSAGFFNANIDRTRAWSWFHVDVWKGPKVGQ